MIIIILAQIGVLKEYSSTRGPNGGTLENLKCLNRGGGLSTSISRTSFKNQKDVSCKIIWGWVHLKNSMHSCVEYSDFQDRSKNPGFFCEKCSFFTKFSIFSQDAKNQKFRLLGVKSHFLKISLPPPFLKYLQFLDQFREFLKIQNRK